MLKDKFEFTLDYQWDLLKFTVLDKEGYKALELYEDSYFTDLHHAIIANGLKRFYKRNKRIPSKAILKEELRDLFKTKDYVSNLLPKDRDEIFLLVNDLFQGHVQDGDQILEKCAKFASYVEVKHEVENVDLLNFQSYLPFSLKIQKAINISSEYKKEKGTFLVADVADRQMQRQNSELIIPTPFKQINRLTNAGGYAKGSIIVILDKPKQFKSTMLVNIGIGYMKMKKKVLLIDFENGQSEYSLRFEQSLIKQGKREILSGEFDKDIRKVLRKYNRIGSELYIKRLPAFSTATEIQALIDELYRDFGVKFEVLLIDYLGLMRSLSNRDDDFGRISDSYVDIANLAMKNDIDHVWTPHHILRAAEKREKSRYKDIDIAKCIDIVRHAQAIYGLNRSDPEKDASILRMELVVQRDGRQDGRALFHVNPVWQRADEFTREEIDTYYTDFKPSSDDFSDDDFSIPSHIRGDKTGDET